MIYISKSEYRNAIKLQDKFYQANTKPEYKMPKVFSEMQKVSEKMYGEMKKNRHNHK